MALDFNGTDDEIDFGDPVPMRDLTHSDFTWMTWINAAGYGESGIGRIFCKVATGTGGSASIPWFIFTSSTSEIFVLQVSHATAVGRWGSPESSIQTGKVYHLAISWDGNSSNDPVFYIDGESVTVSELVTPVGAQPSDTGETLTMGNRPALDRSYDGDLWDMRTYDRILRADEIKSIYTARGRDSNVVGLLARWTMFGESGALRTSQYDMSDNKITGTNTADHVDDPNAGHW
jgi:hypothetical protein